MNIRSSLVFIAFAALVAAAWIALAPPEAPVVTAEEATAVAESELQYARKPDGPAATASARSAAASSVSAIPARRAPPRNAVFEEFLQAKSYKALYDRVSQPDNQTPEAKIVLYEILRECATLSGPGTWRATRPPVPKRDDFVAAISVTDPLRDKRIAAYDDFTTNRCAGLEGLAATRAELNKLLQEAAAAGSPHARAMAIEQELWQSRRQSGDNRATLSDAQIEGLKQSLTTRDPEAIRVAGRVLATSWNDYVLRVGPNQLPVEPRPFMNAWLVLACEYGAQCGADTPRMLQACALQGHCDASSYPDYLMQYASTPHDSTLVSQYRGLLRAAIETGDWSQLTVVRGLPPASNRAWFVAGPR